MLFAHLVHLMNPCPREDTGVCPIYCGLFVAGLIKEIQKNLPEIIRTLLMPCLTYNRVLSVLKVY